MFRTLNGLLGMVGFWAIALSPFSWFASLAISAYDSLPDREVNNIEIIEKVPAMQLSGGVALSFIATACGAIFLNTASEEEIEDWMEEDFDIY